MWTSLVPVLVWEREREWETERERERCEGWGPNSFFFWLVYYGIHNRETGPDLICNKWPNFIFIHIYHMAHKPHLVTCHPHDSHKPHLVLSHPHDGTQSTIGAFVIHMIAHNSNSGPWSSTWWPTSNNTDIQPKISIDEISLLWLFCGCWTRIWY